MNPEIKTKWVAALRSGEFEQGKGALRRADTNQFCCLGVLCELYRRETAHGEWTKSPIDKKMVFLGSLNILPEEVCSWAGLDSVKPRAGGVGLAKHNDTGKTFAEIADIIDVEL